MWNLSGDDIQQAKEQLKTRRAAIQAQYEGDMQRVEAELADIETVERFAMSFVSNYKGAAAPAASADPAPAADKPSFPAEAPREESRSIGSETPLEKTAEGEDAAAIEPAAGEPKGSRWRMRLNARETEAA